MFSHWKYRSAALTIKKVARRSTSCDFFIIFKFLLPDYSLPFSY